ncbi:type II CAAX prenyl endopeptidase Rce1 family protein [Luteimonas salinilitoris]|uniref:CPBP family glutamic-type intramembrane protease n=1 Tax=Luteimonas salinilitoris TaxID=3237697 RepID=A0ABV4HTT8_9GAMM
MEAVIFSLSFAAIAFLIFLSFKYFDKRLTFAFGLLFAAYLGLDDLVTGLPSASSAFSFAGGEWNWSGKVYSLLLSIAVVLGLGIKPEAIGLTLSQRNLTASLIALFLFILWGVSLGLLFKPSAPSVETLAFQALMPGLAEELVYRGIAPALLLGLIRGKEPLQGIPWTVVFITALAFGIWHGLSYSDAKFSFDPMSALFPFIGSIAGGWLRFSSGSLLFPILAHSFANVAFHLTALLGA